MWARAMDIHIAVGDVQAQGWSAEQIAIQLVSRSGDRAELRVSVERIALPPPIHDLREVVVSCAHATITGRLIRCEHGTARLKHPLFADAPFPVAIEYDRQKGLVLTLEELPVAGGTANLRLAVTHQHWSASLQADGLDLAVLKATIQPAIQGEIGGEISVDLAMTGDPMGPHTVSLTTVSDGLGFADPQSVHVGESLALALELNARRDGRLWNYAGDLSWRGGQLYIEPLYLEAPAPSPVRVQATGEWRPGKHRLSIGQLSFLHPGVLRAQVSGEIAFEPSAQLMRAQMAVAKAPLAAIYKTYLQPFLIGTALDDLKLTGFIDASVEYDGSTGRALKLTLDKVLVEDRQRRFGLRGLSADLDWNASPAPRKWRIAFDSGHAYGLSLGGADVVLESTARVLRLRDPVDLPILDGTLRLTDYRLENMRAADVQWWLTAELRPVSMLALTRALNWPAMVGSLSGAMPNAHYADSVFTASGALLVHAFDGEITIDQLRMSDPFGQVPRLDADIKIDNLDLASLTQAFEFGRIEGRLGGRIRDLQLVNWTPVHFDAQLSTPPADGAPHGISQRAVDNLARVGSGVPALLSTGFMRFFENFRYDRLGLSCRLQGAVCLMDGVAPAENGYYIVKGAGVPRIDVIGHNREIQWRELISRLKRIGGESAPIVQ
jgi:hypothetical protein